MIMRRLGSAAFQTPAFLGYSTPVGEAHPRGGATTAELAWGWLLPAVSSSRMAVRSW
jgi:hypothetical protein